MFEKGDEVEVIGNLTGLNQVGNTFIISHPHPTNAMYVHVTQNNMMFQLADLKLVPPTKDKLSAKATRARQAYDLLQSQVEYMEETGEERFEKGKFKNHQLKKLIESEATTELKTERIRALFEAA